jgi:tRNA(His) 5'-end guanylyltransferase
VFDREVEKLVSISAGVASATFTYQAGAPGAFDSRIWVGVNLEPVIAYSRWRQADAARCALTSCVYWMLRNDGRRVAAAQAFIHRMSVAQKNDLPAQRQFQRSVALAAAWDGSLIRNRQKRPARSSSPG